jgi:hypothetical protein
MMNPGPFRAYIHGDPCPDNVFFTGEQLRLIDFEFGCLGHALLDGAYGRMMFPTCWCANRLPRTLLTQMESWYRAVLAAVCPEAEDDRVFEPALVHACASWVVNTLSWHLEGALREDRPWGIATMRPRLLARLEACIATAEEFDQLPAVRGTASRLLEVVDDFKQKYIATAKNADTAWLISALNQLSESEINYKAARNKRLHVELTLIKLAYLNQALHLSQVIPDKKKETYSFNPIVYRRIVPLEIRNDKSRLSGALAIEKTDTGPNDASPDFTERAKLVIEESQKSSSVTTSLGALSKIRQEVVNRKTVAETVETQTLETQPLMEAWYQFTRELKKNKNSAAQSFEGAELRIVDELRFEILTNNNLEQRFIEQEKMKLSDLLQHRFRNKNISFSVVIREQNTQSVPQEKTLTKRDQFYQIAEMYPLVKELKDKLKLELDY